MRKVKVCAVQMNCTENKNENILKAEKMIRKAHLQGANIILLPELFENLYFCQEKRYDYYSIAKELNENDAVKKFSKIANELKIVIIVSFYEKDINILYNSVAIIDADGKILGVYRKTHIPDDHFYQEKFYFTPGNTGFKVWKTEYGKIGVGICWDQWFPESARIMSLMGAELLFYPTAIGSEPILDCDSMPHWRRCIQGHSASNIIPIITSNRVGKEEVKPCKENNYQNSAIIFYGSSFITDETGKIIKSAERDNETIILHEFDLDSINDMKMSWGLFRDRRPETYKKIIE